jgi:hypothetical protein
MGGRINQRVDQVPTGDITQVVAGEALSGGGVAGAVQLDVVLEDADLILATSVFAG